MVDELSNTCPDHMKAKDCAGQICDTQKPGDEVVRYHFPPDYFKSTGNKVIDWNNVERRLDPNGQSTLLWALKDGTKDVPWEAQANEVIHVEMTWLNYGGNFVNPWIHDGEVQGTGKCWCEQKVLANNRGQVEVVARSNVVGKGDAKAPLRYADTGTGEPVWMVTTIHVEGGTNGRARMKSLGTHVNAN